MKNYGDAKKKKKKILKGQGTGCRQHYLGRTIWNRTICWGGFFCKMLDETSPLDGHAVNACTLVQYFMYT